MLFGWFCLSWDTLTLHTQPPFQYSLLVDAPDSPPQRLHKDASDITQLSSEGDLPGYHLTATDENLFSVYQDWVHQNPVTHLDDGIEEDGKW